MRFLFHSFKQQLEEIEKERKRESEREKQNGKSCRTINEGITFCKSPSNNFFFGSLRSFDEKQIADVSRLTFKLES